jgi:hypothetical protein
MFIQPTRPVTQVDTIALYPLGSLYWESDSVVPAAAKDNGGRVWQYVKNDEAATSFTAGRLVRRKLGANTKLAILLPNGATTNPAACLGVVQHTIVAQSFGWVLKRGVGTILSDDTGITVDQFLIPGNNAVGSMDSTSTATTAAIGYAIDTIAASSTGLGFIDCPG